MHSAKTNAHAVFRPFPQRDAMTQSETKLQVREKHTFVAKGHTTRDEIPEQIWRPSRIAPDDRGALFLVEQPDLLKMGHARQFGLKYLMRLPQTGPDRLVVVLRPECARDGAPHA